MYEPRIGDYALCKHMNGISKQNIDDMAEEDVLFWMWMMKRENKKNPEGSK